MKITIEINAWPGTGYRAQITRDEWVTVARSSCTSEDEALTDALEFIADERRYNRFGKYGLFYEGETEQKERM